MSSPSIKDEEVSEEVVDLLRPDYEPYVPKESREIQKEKAAARIAQGMVLGLLLLLFVPLLLLGLSVVEPAEAVDLIKTIAAVLGGPVGAVLGYYFRIKTS